MRATRLQRGVDHRGAVADLLRRMGRCHQALKDAHRANAYAAAAHAVSSLPAPLTSAEQTLGVRGIGPKIFGRVEEAIKTGTLVELVDLEEKAACSDLGSVMGVGPAMQKKLKSKYGITTVSQLLAKRGEIPLTKMQRVGLEYYSDLQERIPRLEADRHVELVEKCIASVNPRPVVEVCGSYRRKLPTSGDIDFLISCQSRVNFEGLLDDVLSKINEESYIIENLARGKTKVMLVAKLPAKTMNAAEFLPKARRVDIRVVPFDAMPTALLYFTGSALFNVRMREHANAMGFILNEYGLYRARAGSTKAHDDMKVAVTCEKDIFEAIEFPWLEPPDRTA